MPRGHTDVGRGTRPQKKFPGDSDQVLWIKKDEVKAIRYNNNKSQDGGEEGNSEESPAVNDVKAMPKESPKDVP